MSEELYKMNSARTEESRNQSLGYKLRNFVTNNWLLILVVVVAVWYFYTKYSSENTGYSSSDYGKSGTTLSLGNSNYYKSSVGTTTPKDLRMWLR
jgi:hypothetical protein